MAEAAGGGDGDACRPPPPRVLVLHGLVPAPAGEDDGREARLLARLPIAMQAEITRYRRAEDRMARIAARLLLGTALTRLGLGAHAGLEAWERTAAGRPFLRGVPGVDVSLSHSGGWAAAAVGLGCRVGLDIEPWQRAIGPDAFAFLLTGAERARIAALAPDEAAAARELLRCWTLREAVLKADGSGLLAEEDAIRAIGEGRYPHGRRWHVRHWAAGPGWLALATDAEAARIDIEQTVPAAPG